MSYKYGSCLFDTPRQASLAAVSDFVFAVGNNSMADVAQMDAQDTAEQMAKEGWSIPFLSKHTSSVVDLAQEIIDYARDKFVTEAEAEELDEILDRTCYTNGAVPVGGGARADAAIYNLAREELSKRIG